MSRVNLVQRIGILTCLQIFVPAALRIGAEIFVRTISGSVGACDAAAVPVAQLNLLGDSNPSIFVYIVIRTQK